MDVNDESLDLSVVDRLGDVVDSMIESPSSTAASNRTELLPPRSFRAPSSPTSIHSKRIFGQRYLPCNARSNGVISSTFLTGNRCASPESIFLLSDWTRSQVAIDGNREIQCPAGRSETIIRTRQVERPACGRIVLTRCGHAMTVAADVGFAFGRIVVTSMWERPKSVAARLVCR